MKKLSVGNHSSCDQAPDQEVYVTAQVTYQKKSEHAFILLDGCIWMALAVYIPLLRSSDYFVLELLHDGAAALTLSRVPRAASTADGTPSNL